MKTLLLIIALSFGVLAQDHVKCSFEINDNESKHEGLRKSKLEFNWELSDGEQIQKDLDFVKLIIDPEREDSYKHKVVIFEEDHEIGSFLGENNIDYRGVRLGEKLSVNIEREGDRMFLGFSTRTWNFDLSLGGIHTREISRPVYIEASFKDMQRSFPIFGKRREVVEHISLPVIVKCQKLANDFVIDSDSQEEFEFEKSVREARERSNRVENQ